MAHLAESLEEVLPIRVVQCWVKISRPLHSCHTWSLSMACPERIKTLDWQLSALEADTEGAGWHICMFTKLTGSVILLWKQHNSGILSQELLSSFQKSLYDLPILILWMELPRALTMLASDSPLKMLLSVHPWGL